MTKPVDSRRRGLDGVGAAAAMAPSDRCRDARPRRNAAGSHNVRFNNAIAIIVALISAFLAVSKIKGDNVVQAIQRAQALTVDAWSQYQAKRMRQFELDLEVVRADALIRDGVLKDTPENQAMTEGWRKEIDRYKGELKELSDAANGYEADFKRHNETDGVRFSESFLTLALALLAVAALTRIGWLSASPPAPASSASSSGWRGFCDGESSGPNGCRCCWGREPPLFCRPDQPSPRNRALPAVTHPRRTAPRRARRSPQGKPRRPRPSPSP